MSDYTWDELSGTLALDYTWDELPGLDSFFSSEPDLGIKEELAGAIDNSDLLIVYNPMEKLLPDDGNYRFQFLKMGGISPSLSSDRKYLYINDDSLSEMVLYVHELKNQIQLNSDFELSVDLEVTASTGIIEFALCDGFKYLHFRIGSYIEICDEDGNAYYTSEEQIPFDERINIRIIKHGAQYVEIFINEDLAKTFAYYNAKTAAGEKYFWWGSGINGTSEFKVYYLNYGINNPLPTEAEKRRALSHLPPWIEKNELGKAIANAFLQAFKFIKNGISSISDMKDSDRVIIASDIILGDVLPDDLLDPWTAEGGPLGSGLAVESQFSEVKITDESATKYYDYKKEYDGVDQYHDFELDFHLTIDSWTVDGNDFMGCGIEFSDGEKVFRLGFQDSSDEYKIGFIDSGAFISDTFHLEPRIKNRIRILKAHNDKVFVSINGIVFAITSYANFAAAPGGTTPYIKFGSLESSLESTTRWKIVKTFISISGNVFDSTFYPYFLKKNLLQECYDSNLRPSKSETNTLLRWLLEHRIGLHRMRGTLKGITLESKHINTTEDVYIVTDQLQTGWFCEHGNDHLEWIWLESGTNLNENHVDVKFENPSHQKPGKISPWMKKNLLPYSTRESLWDLNHIATIQSIDTSNPSYEEVTVDSTKFFEAGDTIKIRKADNSYYETSEVQSVIDTTTLRIDKLNDTYTTNDFIRKFYAGHNKANS